jgi:hypothetical protein
MSEYILDDNEYNSLQLYLRQEYLSDPEPQLAYN